jgi:hypothetical protein
MLFAVATLGKKHANPFGPELQVKQMLGGRAIGPLIVNKKILQHFSPKNKIYGGFYEKIFWYTNIIS